MSVIPWAPPPALVERTTLGLIEALETNGAKCKKMDQNTLYVEGAIDLPRVVIAALAAFRDGTRTWPDTGIVAELRAFGEMPLEGDNADPLIEVMNSLAHQAADEIENLRADSGNDQAVLILQKGEIKRLRDAALSASGLGDAVAIMRDIVAPFRGKPDAELPDGHIIARARAWLKRMEE